MTSSTVLSHDGLLGYAADPTTLDIGMGFDLVAGRVGLLLFDATDVLPVINRDGVWAYASDPDPLATGTSMGFDFISGSVELLMLKDYNVPTSVLTTGGVSSDALTEHGHPVEVVTTVAADASSDYLRESTVEVLTTGAVSADGPTAREHPIDGVITTGAVHQSTVTVRSTPIVVMTTAGADAAGVALRGPISVASRVMVGASVGAGVVKNLSTAVRTTVGVATFTSFGLITANVAVKTFVGVHAYTGPGLTTILDENHDPILDELGFPILAMGPDGIEKNVTVGSLTTVGVASFTMLITGQVIDVAVLTTIGSRSGAGVSKDVGVESMTPVAVIVTTDVEHNLAIASETDVGAFVGVDAGRTAIVGVETAVGAYIAAASEHAVDVASITTVGAFSGIGLNLILVDVEVLTTMGGGQSANTQHSVPIVVVVDAAGMPISLTTHDYPIESSVDVGVMTFADTVKGSTGHEAFVGSVVTGGAFSGAEVGHDSDTQVQTYVGVEARAAVLRTAIVEALTTVGVYVAANNPDLTRLCLELVAAFDAVSIEFEECD